MQEESESAEEWKSDAGRVVPRAAAVTAQYIVDLIL